MTAGQDRAPLVEILGVTKDYHGLRPLRIEHLAVFPGDRVALLGFDQIAAEVLVNLATGATLPDGGRISIFGRETAGVSDSADWLTLVDRFGIVSARAALLGAMTALQNLALPLTLDVEPLRDDTRARAEKLASAAGLARELWLRQVGELDSAAQMQVRLGRALALDPALLLLEHVSAGLSAAGAATLAQSAASSATERGAAVISIGVDESFARRIANRVLRWEPATGRLRERRGWFGGRLG